MCQRVPQNRHMHGLLALTSSSSIAGRCVGCISLAIAPVAAAAVLLSWITTGDHPIAAAAQGFTQIWSMDLVLLATAAVAIFAASRLKVTVEEAIDHAAKPGQIPAEAYPAE